jgi:shikimate kinase
MGAGKSTVGRRLAERLRMPFRDADAEIEAAAGRSIAELFQDFGETYFRDGERRVIKRLLKGPPHVLATGGGAFLDLRTRKLIRRRALSVWLKADLDVLTERVMRRDHRPLLRNGDPRSVMARLIEERYPVYAEADIIVETGIGPHEDVVRRILKALEQRRRQTPAGEMR